MRIRFFAVAHISLIGTVLLLASLVGCGGGGSSSSTSTTPPSNPLPSLSSISPTSATVGSPDTPVTLTGSGFIKGSSVNLDGKPQTTNFVSSTELSTTLPDTSFAQAATHSITVTNPSPGGGTSTSASFAVYNLAPVLASFTPSVVTPRSPNTQIQLIGSNFLPTSTVIANSNLIPSTYVSATLLVATVPSSDLTSPGTVLLSVTNPAPGGGGSSELELQVGTQISDEPGVQQDGAPDPEALSYMVGPPAESTPNALQHFSNEDISQKSKPRRSAAARASSTRGEVQPQNTCSEIGPDCVPGVPWTSQVPPGDWQHTANCGPASMLLVQGKLCSKPVDMVDGIQAINTYLTCDDPESCAFPDFQGEVDLANGRVTSDPSKLDECLMATSDFSVHCPGGGLGTGDLGKIAQAQLGLDAQPNQISILSSGDCSAQLTWLKQMLDSQTPVIVHVDYKLGLDPLFPVGQAGHYMILVGIDGTGCNNTVYVVDPGVSDSTNGYYSNSTTTSNSTTPLVYTVSQFLQSWKSHGYDTLVLSGNESACTVNTPSLGIVAQSLSSLTAGAVGVPYSASFVAQFGAEPYSWSVVPSQGDLPPGTQLNAGTGILSGTPLSSGTFSFTVQVTDSDNNVASGVATINIGSAVGPITITTPGDLQSATAGSSYGFPLSASGGTAPYHWSVNGVTCPTAISGIDGICISGGGTIQGTPTNSTNGVISFSLQVVDSSTPSQTASKMMNLTVLPTNLPPQVYSVTALPSTVGEQGSSTLTCTAVDPQQLTLSYAWAVTGGNVSGSGAIVTWTAPSSVGGYTGTCTVTSTVGLSATGSILLQVSNSPLTSSISPTSGTVGVTQFTVNGSGATLSGGVTATITLPNTTTTTSHTTANGSGQYSFGPFTESATGVYTEIDSDDKTGGKSLPFSWTVSASTAVPTITSVTPNPVPGSNSAQQITINGSNFQSGATLTYHDPQGNSYPGHSSTFVNSGQLLDPAFNDASDAGTWTVTVVNPGGQSSTAFNFTVSASTAVPTVTSVSPNPVPGSNSAQKITINGSNFQSGATLTYHDPQGNSYPGHSSTFVNSGQFLDPAFNDASDAGTWTVTVVNPGGQSSTAFNFTVSASTAVPTITSVTPNPVPGSNSAQKITINGSNFVSGATLTYHDPQGNSYPGHSSTFVNSGSSSTRRSTMPVTGAPGR